MDDKPKFIDSHAHVQFSAYDEDREEIIKKAFAVGVWMINSGSNSKNSADAVKLAERYDQGVYATIGIHPSHAGKETTEITEYSGTEAFDENKMTKLAISPKVLAVGECGLEYFREFDAASQKKLFEEHINFARKIDKPLVIHCRNAYRDVYNILRANKNLLNKRGGVMHFFSGSADEAREFLDIGFNFSFGGAITFPKKSKGADLKGLAEALPLERILLETDAPYVSPVPYRGKRNEPAYIVETAKRLAEIKKIPLEDVIAATTENTRRIFAIGGISG